ncbi:outer membrane protein assembly factor BamB family protein [Spirosoma endbachense]|uniref:PQQ-binding-like beta-propeller repeat protein n=1 Tax=Spirosoma endbachense TaxID=2666025 RepID=A0A6P1VX72_9BACT|nr:PQQ-binding-like beta-propeller repeat protein [Spirosoma endbachense]QHV97791.1 PQQ-binding-like beta-propeller repeat protein [Spirosoma endbachense]
MKINLLISSLVLLVSFWHVNAQSNTTVYIGSGDGKLYALDAQNGTKKWDYTIASGQKVNASPTVSNGLVYAGGTGGNSLRSMPRSAPKSGMPV